MNSLKPITPEKESVLRLIPETRCEVDVKASDLKKYVKQAIESLNQDPKGTKHLFEKTEKGQHLPIGSFFLKAITKLALPTEVQTLSRRYGLELKSLMSKKTLTPQEVLGYAAAFCDITEATETLQKTGLEGTALKISQFVQQRLQETGSIRGEIKELLKDLDLEEVKGGFKKHMKLFKDLTRLQLAHKTMTVEHFYEILTKKMASAFLEEGMKIPLPKLINPATGELSSKQGYLVVKKQITERGLMAFALVPQDAPEFIKKTVLFRPTTTNLSQENALQTFADDLCDHVGKRSYEAAIFQLESMLEELLPGHETGHVCGFSLGGAHAARLLSDFPEYFSEATFFNDPSTEEDVAKTFIKNLSQTQHTCRNPLKINIIHTDKDVVPLSGDVHIGYCDSSWAGAEFNRTRFTVNLKTIKTEKTEQEIDETPTPSICQLVHAIFNKKGNPLRDCLKRRASYHTDLVLNELQDPISPALTDDSEESDVETDSIKTDDPSSPTSDAPRRLSNVFIMTDLSAVTQRSSLKNRAQTMDLDYLKRSNDCNAQIVKNWFRAKVVMRTLAFGILIIFHNIGKFFSNTYSLIGRCLSVPRTHEQIIKERLATRLDFETLRKNIQRAKKTSSAKAV
jgi:hypothetical protein